MQLPHASCLKKMGELQLSWELGDLEALIKLPEESVLKVAPKQVGELSNISQ